jgi:hypothetical protein
MPSTTKHAEITVYESTHASPFTRLHGQPIQSDYNTSKSEACALASNVENITYLWSKNATNNYDLLADILGADKYDKLTGIDFYIVPVKPALYDPTITNAMLTHERKCREEE